VRAARYHFTGAATVARLFIVVSHGERKQVHDRLTFSIEILPRVEDTTMLPNPDSSLLVMLLPTAFQLAK
jgi:hypothetical protein